MKFPPQQQPLSITGLQGGKVLVHIGYCSELRIGNRGKGTMEKISDKRGRWSMVVIEHRGKPDLLVHLGPAILGGRSLMKKTCFESPSRAFH
jgi:hypothetical protein